MSSASEAKPDGHNVIPLRRRDVVSIYKTIRRAVVVGVNAILNLHIFDTGLLTIS